MSATLLRQHIFIQQGSDFSQSFPFADAADGDIARSELRRWAGPGAPLMATFDASVDATAKTVTISLDASVTRKLIRDGEFDIQVEYGGRFIPIVSGKAKLIPGVTQPDLSFLTWEEFGPMTWDEWERITWGNY